MPQEFSFGSVYFFSAYIGITYPRETQQLSNLEIMNFDLTTEVPTLCNTLLRHLI